MSLIYRGQPAQASIMTETVETGMTGTFLGRSFPIRHGQPSPPPPYPPLQYRGAIY